MLTMSWSRWRAASGIIYALLGALPLGFFPPPPAVRAPIQEIVTYYQIYGTQFQITNYLGILSIVFFLLFLGSLCVELEQTRQHSYFARVSFAAGIAWATIFCVFSGLIQSQPLLAANTSTHDFLQVFSNLTDTAFTTSYIPAFMLVGASSLAFVHSTGVIRWVGYSGFVIALIELLASLGLLIPTGPLVAGGMVYDIAFALFAVWILLTSLAMMVKKS